MNDLSDYWFFFATFAWLMGAGLGGPFPEEIPTIAAGIWVASNPELGPIRWLILPVCFLGVLIADIMLYGIGRLSGYRLLERPWVKRIIPPNKWDQTRANFDRYGFKVLLLIRWVPAIRSPMFITAGIMRLSLPRFIVADGIALIFGHSLLFFLAWWFGDQVAELANRLEAQVDHYKPLLILLGLAAVAGALFYHFLQRPISTGDPDELPLIGEKVAAKLEHQTPSASAATVHIPQANGPDGVATEQREEASSLDRPSVH